MSGRILIVEDEPKLADLQRDYLEQAGDVFVENLQRCLEGREMLNVVEWSRGY